MTSVEIRDLVNRTTQRLEKKVQNPSQVQNHIMEALTSGRYNKAVIRKQKNFTIAHLMSTLDKRLPTLIGVSKRNPKEDENDTIALTTSISAAVNNVRTL